MFVCRWQRARVTIWICWRYLGDRERWYGPAGPAVRRGVAKIRKAITRKRRLGAMPDGFPIAARLGTFSASGLSVKQEVA